MAGKRPSTLELTIYLICIAVCGGSIYGLYQMKERLQNESIWIIIGVIGFIGVEALYLLIRRLE